MKRTHALLLGLALGALAFAWWRTRALPAGHADGGGARTDAPVSSTPPAEFVDEASCAGCHPDEATRWRGSHHDLAMQPAEEGTVLGDFAAAHFEDANGRTDFRREGARFLVDTVGPDGARGTFPVEAVFGIEPLQQVLLPLGAGKTQALSIAWDTELGRWYTLYPGETIPPGDPLHWTRPAFNWNFSCAECHATDLRRHYDASKDSYATRAARLDVGCQACHGPAGTHLAWATGQGGERPGFDAPLGADGVREIEACARCHARRAPLDDGFDHRHRLMDDYLPALLSEELYYADGQIQDEVYEYGSFLQSKMHEKGVRCSDCHDPHGLGLHRPKNQQCTTCHSAAPELPAHVDGTALARKAYDTPEHHHHAAGTPGSFCVDCHMPTRTYMGVDERRDHGFRIPRPDLAARMASPDPCARCHAERGSAWAAESVRAWFGTTRPPEPFGVALAAGRAGAPGAADALLALVRSPASAIVRASALELLARYPGQPALEAFAFATRDPDPLVRHASLGGLEALPPEERLPLVGPLLSDPQRAVRAEATRLCFALPSSALGPFAEAAARAREEYAAIQRALAERPEARLNLAQLLTNEGQAEAARAELLTALRLEPRFVPARVNLAELSRARGESEVEGTLRDGLATPGDARGEATLRHALALSLVRQGRATEARVEFARAAELAPDEPRFGYVHAIALQDAGDAGGARRELARVLARAPWFRDAAFALAGFQSEAGDEAGAQATLAALAAINPHDPGLAAGPR